MSYQGQRGDFYFDVARGIVSGMQGINVWGHAQDGFQLTMTDMWDRADAVPTQQIWLAPTAARIHNIVSTSASDDGSPAGVGAQTVRVYGLTSWSTAETSELVTMNGTTPVATVNSYVMINKLYVETFGASGPNVGTITATAVTNNTVTAAIIAGNGESNMSIYGIPSTQKAYIVTFFASLNDSTGTARVDFFVRVCSDPVNNPSRFHIDRSFNLTNTGTSSYHDKLGIPFVLEGPAILKLSGIASVADLDVAGGYDLVLVNN